MTPGEVCWQGMCVSGEEYPQNAFSGFWLDLDTNLA